jgi:hypothetical protein
MDIRIATGKAPRVTLTVTEERGLRSTLDILKGVRDHLEPTLDPLDEDYTTDSVGTAELLLLNGFEKFVDRYAPEETPEEEAAEPDDEKGK